MSLYFLHLGKTGGTAMKRVLRLHVGRTKTSYGDLKLPGHSMHLEMVPGDDYVMFCVRDPISRFASAFYSRLTQGQPRYYYPWEPNERIAFERFPTPQALASGLASDDKQTRSAAAAAMKAIRHAAPLTESLGTRRDLEQRLDHVIYIGAQETLASDWQQLRVLLELPETAQLPNDAIAGHQGDPTLDRTFDAEQEKALREWYAEDFAIVEWCNQIRAERGWGVGVPGALPGRAPAGAPEPSMLPPGPLTREGLVSLGKRVNEPRLLWVGLVRHLGAQRIGEIGIGAGENAQRLLAECPDIETYYLIGRKPGPREPGRWRRQLTIDATEMYADKRVLLFGDTQDVIDEIPDGSLDFLYIGKAADHSLRGIAIDLIRGYPKVRPGGWIGGHDFSPRIWHKGYYEEPSLVFPYVVHFAESMGDRVFSLRFKHFLIEKQPQSGPGFVDVVGSYRSTALNDQDPGPRPPRLTTLYRRLRRRAGRIYWSRRSGRHQISTLDR